jgi:DNA-binding XRE family transcriptional regulator
MPDFNQTDFTNKISVSQGSLSDLESGKSKPAIETVLSIVLHLVVLRSGF